jgi:hypothetical protein
MRFDESIVIAGISLSVKNACVKNNNSYNKLIIFIKHEVVAFNIGFYDILQEGIVLNGTFLRGLSVVLFSLLIFACFGEDDRSVTGGSVTNTRSPDIIAHPQGGTYSLETAAILSVSATSPDGGVLSYQWYKNSVNNNTGGTAIAGAIEASYTPPTSALGTVYYYVVVTNTNIGVNGNKTMSIISSAIAVTVASGYKVSFYGDELDLLGSVRVESGIYTLADLRNDYTWYVAKTETPVKHYDVNRDINFYALQNVHEIRMETELDAIRNDINWGQIGYYILMNDIPLTEATLDEEEGWLPIGDEYIGNFIGIFNGDGFKVTGLYINTTEIHAGLFGMIEDSIIKNLGVEISEKGINATCPDGNYIGGIVGEALDSIIINSYSNGNIISVSGDRTYVGGIVGYAESTSISGSHSAGNISVRVDEDGYVGGIVGISTSGYIYNSHSTGNISVSIEYRASVGGIAGIAGCTISNSYSSKDISAITNHLVAPGFTYAGGIVGEFYGTITNSYSTGDVSGSGFFAYVGGIVGHVRYASISGSYSIGEISVASVYSPDVGGIAGFLSYGEVTKCAAANPTISAEILITESEPLQEDVFINRIVGFIDTVSSDAKNNIAYSAMSAFIDGAKVVFNSAPANYGSSRTLEALQKQSTYEGIGWKFGNDDKNPWKMPADKGLPILYWQP